MPPLPEDEESGSGREDPSEVIAKGGGEDADSDEGDGADEFVIEKVIAHDWDKSGELIYEVKWEGYDNPTDNTWEPEENLESAKEALKEYFKKIGGKPEAKPKSKKRKAGASLNGSAVKRGRSETPEPAGRRKSGGGDRKAGADFKPPKGSWENDIASIDTIEQVRTEKGELQLMVYVLWNTGEKTRHTLRQATDKCPQKMLKYYEDHLVFKGGEEEL